MLKIQKSSRWSNGGLKIFFTDLEYSLKRRTWIRITAFQSRSPEMQILEVVPVPEFVCYELELHYFNFLFPGIVRLVYSAESKSWLRSWLSILPFNDTSDSKQKLVANVTNIACILNIPAWKEPRYCLLATSSWKCLLQCGFLCVYLDSQVMTSLWQFWNALPTVPSISRTWAGQIREMSPECAKNGGGLEKGRYLSVRQRLVWFHLG